MTSDPWVVFLKIVLLVVFVKIFLSRPFGQRITRFLPTPFWIYFLPMILSSLGVFPTSSAAYDMLNVFGLPAALFLTLVGTPLKAILRLGRPAAASMALASVTVFVSAIVTYALFYKFLPAESASAVGALIGTWIGGSANMLAVKEALLFPDEKLAPLILVDTVLSYAWMALLLAAVQYSRAVDRWNFHTTPAHEANLPMPIAESVSSRWKRNVQIIPLLVLSMLFSLSANVLGSHASRVFPLLNDRAWTLLLASLLAVLLAGTPLKHLEGWKASRLGGYLLYLVLAGIGARSTFQKAAGDAPIYFLYGLTLLALHGGLLLAIGHWLKLPFYLLATASQANIGGPISAPLVAAAYRPEMAQFGVLMGICGNLVGTYAGLGGAWILHALFR